MKTVYLLCGVSGSGKSWVADKLSSLIHYSSYDKLGFVQPTRSLELHDRTTLISTTINDFKNNDINVIPIFILGDFLRVKKQLVDRGGKITASLYRRWKRVNNLANTYSRFTGDSTEVYKFLYNELKHRDIEHTIYKATSPSGKIYVGKTNQGLDKRKYDHYFHARNKNTTYFDRAINKYGDLLRWEEITRVRGLEEANKLECKFILDYKSYDRNFGYNSTMGGDGGVKNEECERAKSLKVKIAFQNPELRKKLSEKTKNQWSNNRDRMSASIRAVRSTKESRKKTSEQQKRMFASNPDIFKYDITDETRKRLSDSLLKRHGCRFAAYKDDMLIGEWTNQKFAADELGIPACTISRVLGGHLRQAYGYVFKYL